MQKIDLIQRDKYYSILMIYKLSLFDWINSYDVLKRLIIRDIEDNGNKTFQAIVSGKGNGRRYLIKGSKLISICKKSKRGYRFNGLK